MKKILAFLGIAMFCFSLTAWADNKVNLEAAYVSGDYGYNLNEDGSATIVWFNKDDNYQLQYYPEGPVLYIPNTLDGHPVTKLGNASFSYNTPRSITAIVVPEGVTTIERAALNSEWLPAVYLPSTLTSIDTFAFNGVKTVVCNSANVKIEKDAFFRCTGTAFYGHPSSTLEDFVTKTANDNLVNCTFADIAVAPAVDIAAGTYLVKIDTHSEGSVTVSSDYAKAGEVITVTINTGNTTKRDIRVDERGVYARNKGTEVAVTNHGNGVFTFTMPDSSVYIGLK